MILKTKLWIELRLTSTYTFVHDGFENSDKLYDIVDTIAYAAVKDIFNSKSDSGDLKLIMKNVHQEYMKDHLDIYRKPTSISDYTPVKSGF